MRLEVTGDGSGYTVAASCANKFFYEFTFANEVAASMLLLLLNFLDSRRAFCLI